MTDYEEEQRNEMEAMESIYPQEITGYYCYKRVAGRTIFAVDMPFSRV